MPAGKEFEVFIAKKPGINLPLTIISGCISARAAQALQ
jgi:hypothetical protein